MKSKPKTELFARILAIIGKWDKHIEPGSEWHAQECCIDELVADLKEALYGKQSEAAAKGGELRGQ